MYGVPSSQGFSRDDYFSSSSSGHDPALHSQSTFADILAPTVAATSPATRSKASAPNWQSKPHTHTHTFNQESISSHPSSSRSLDPSTSSASSSFSHSTRSSSSPFSSAERHQPNRKWQETEHASPRNRYDSEQHNAHLTNLSHRLRTPSPNPIGVSPSSPASVMAAGGANHPRPRFEPREPTRKPFAPASSSSSSGRGKVDRELPPIPPEENGDHPEHFDEEDDDDDDDSLFRARGPRSPAVTLASFLAESRIDYDASQRNSSTNSNRSRPRHQDLLESAAISQSPARGSSAAAREPHAGPSSPRKSRARTLSSGNGIVGSGLKKWGKASATALRKWSEKDASSLNDGASQGSSLRSPRQSYGSRSTREDHSAHSGGSSAGAASKAKNWGALGMGNLRALSAQASKSASALASNSRGHRAFAPEEEYQASWDPSKLKIPSTSSMDPGSRPSSSSGDTAYIARSHKSQDYAFPPGPIAEPDPRIGLPYRVQHNVHVDVGPEGYTGLPASWARHLTEKNADDEEDDPRLRLESRIGGDYQGSRRQTRSSDPPESPHSYSEGTPRGNGANRSRYTGSMASGNSSGRGTARPSMAASRASTSYSSVLQKGWDDWSDGAGLTPPPPVPPLPSGGLPTPGVRSRSLDDPEGSPRTMTSRANGDQGHEDDEEEQHRRHQRDGGHRDARRSDDDALGLGLNLGFNLVSKEQGNSKGSGLEHKSPLLPDFLSSGGKEDEDWALALLNSIPAGDDAEGLHTPSPAITASQATSPARTDQTGTPSLTSSKSTASTAASPREEKALKRRSKSLDYSAARRLDTKTAGEKPASRESSRRTGPPPLPTASVPSGSKLHPDASAESTRAEGKRPSSRASRKSVKSIKSVKSKGPSRRGSKRATRGALPGVSGWSDDDDDDDDLEGEDTYSDDPDDEEVQISTATAEKVAKSAAPRALTHSQYLGKVRRSPSSTNESPTFSSPRTAAGIGPRSPRQGVAKSPKESPGSPTTPRRRDLQPAPSGPGPLRIDPKLADQVYRKKFGIAVNPALDSLSPNDASDSSGLKSGWSPASSPADEKSPAQPRTPSASIQNLGRGLANLKLGTLAANAKKVASPSIPIPPNSANPVSSLFSLKTSSASKSTPTLTSRNASTARTSRDHEPVPSLPPHSASSTQRAANASAESEKQRENPHGSTYAPSLDGTASSTGHGYSTADSAVGNSGSNSRILGLRERRRLNTPNRIYPPNSKQNRSRSATTSSNHADSDLGHGRASDAGSSAVGRRDSNSSAGGHRRGSIRGFFRRESDQGEGRGLAGRGSITTSSNSQHTDTASGMGLGLLAAVRNRSGSTSGADLAPKVPPKDSTTPWTQPTSARPTQIEFIRPNADGFFTIPSAKRGPATPSGESIQAPSSAHGSHAADHRAGDVHSARSPGVHQGSTSPRPSLGKTEYGEEPGYAANDYLEQWMDESYSPALSPGQLSNTSHASDGRTPGYQASGNGPISASMRPYEGKLALPLPSSQAHGQVDPSMLSPSGHSASSSRNGLGSPANGSPNMRPDRGLYSPNRSHYPDSPTAMRSPVSQYSTTSSAVDKPQPPLPPAAEDDTGDLGAGARVRSGTGVEHLAYSSAGMREDPLSIDGDVREVNGHRISTSSMPETEYAPDPEPRPAAVTKRVPSPDADALEAANAARPSSRMSTSSKTSRRTTRTPRRSTDTRNRFPVSMHYASGFSDTFFDVSDGTDMPRESFDLDDVLPQHLNDVPPVPPLPAASHHFSSPSSPVPATRPLPPMTARAGAQTPNSKSPKLGGSALISPAASRAPSRNSSTSMRRSPRRRSRSRSRAHLPSGITSSRKFDLGLPDVVKPAARFLSAADPERIFSDLSLIGAGDSGDVYSAIGPGGGASSSSSSQEIVAIKVIKLHPPRDSKTEQEEGVSRLDGLSSELALWSSCKHENILALYDVFFAAPQQSQFPGVWITQELADRSLADIVSLKPAGLELSERAMARLMSDILQGLQILHAKRIIHRDVRSDNVLICGNGVAKLSDFTHAVQLEPEGAESKRRSVVGTAYWMAPELIKAQPYAVEVDVWSMGATLYELCEGDPPNVAQPPLRAIAMTAKSGLPKLTKVGGKGGKGSSATGTGTARSKALRSFLASATEMIPAKRANVEQLLKSDFIAKRSSREKIMELLDEARVIEENAMEDEDEEEEESDSDGPDAFESGQDGGENDEIVPPPGSRIGAKSRSSSLSAGTDAKVDTSRPTGTMPTKPRTGSGDPGVTPKSAPTPASTAAASAPVTSSSSSKRPNRQQQQGHQRGQESISSSDTVRRSR